jgi:sugar transferase EpsL
VKIIFDRIVSFLSLVLLMPIFLLLGIVIYFDLGLPIFFRQKRPGLNGDPFVFFKFRTMLDEKDKEGNFLSEKNRITKLGRFLRGLSLDELPSIINVLKGDMSFVGPRPLLMEYLPLYSKDQFSRHNVKPGITGWAQINGRNSISWEEKFQLDLWYIKNHSFSLDLKILFLTLWKVFIRDGINSSENISMRPFLGSDEK